MKTVLSPSPVITTTSDKLRASHPLIGQFTEKGFKEEDRKAHFETFHKGKKAVQLAAEQVACQNAIEYIDELHKVLQAEFDAIRMRLLPDAMDEENLNSPLNVAGVGRVTLTPDLQINVPAETKEGFFKWLKKKKLGDLIQPNINPSTLKAWAKARIAEGKEIPSELLKLTPITRASITRAK